MEALLGALKSKFCFVPRGKSAWSSRFFQVPVVLVCSASENIDPSNSRQDVHLLSVETKFSSEYVVSRNIFSTIFSRRYQSGCIKVNRVTCVRGRVGRCGSMFGGAYPPGPDFST